MTPENAEILGFQALGWLAGEEDALQRLMDQSGMDAGSLRDGAGTAEVSVAVLDFLLGHEDLLLRFCESAEVAAKDVHLARHRLGGEF